MQHLQNKWDSNSTYPWTPGHLKRQVTTLTGVRLATISSTIESLVKSLEKVGKPNHKTRPINMPKPAPICSNMKQHQKKKQSPQ
jgi:hypothetical protein